MVVAVGELDLELDPAEERRRGVEHQPVGPGVAAAELADAAVGVGLSGTDELPRLPQLDADALRRPPVLGVEDMGRDHHGPTLRRKAGGGEPVLPRDLGLLGVDERAATDDAPELDELNRDYEERFGFRFVVFVNGRPKRELVPVLRARMARTREEELATAIDELCAIAEDRWRRS